MVKNIVRKAAEREVKVISEMRGGPGETKLINLINDPEELGGKGRLYAKVILRPGCGVGWHVHEDDSELYYILKGTVIYDDDGVKKEITVGDVTITGNGAGHALMNESDSDVELVALVLYK